MMERENVMERTSDRGGRPLYTLHALAKLMTVNEAVGRKAGMQVAGGHGRSGQEIF